MATFCQKVFDTESPANVSPPDVNILDEPVVSSPIGESAPKMPSQPPMPLTNVPSATLPIPSEREKERLEGMNEGLKLEAPTPSRAFSPRLQCSRSQSQRKSPPET